MTRKLRCQFVTITMSIVTVMLCAIMFLIYFFTKMNLENNSINMMQNIASRPFLLHLPNEQLEDVRLPYFTIQLSIQGDIIATGGGYYDLSDEDFLKDLIKATFSSSDRVGIIEEYNLRFYRAGTSVSQILVYADISNELAILNSLIRNCILVEAVCFLAFLCISFVLAHWVAKPIDRAWDQQRQFIADASHELKTPLTVIMTNAELMQNPDYDETSRIKFSSSILVMSKQMRNLVEQMLELARADAVQCSTVFSSVDFSRLISDATLPFEPVFFEKGLTLHTEIAAGITVNGAPAQLRQVLDILLDNAQKYSWEKGTTWVTLKKHGKGHCLLTVANEGAKIPASDLSHLFKRFYRADKARSRTGNMGQSGSFGLGLSIAETIIAQHKGKIWAESKNHINCFFVELGTNP
ncbi:MAG: HAMP domain-containing histidine kinase [Lachnospiraceae bacterium]|nr:HAMP domain-containing histidine kinase [Lachnospiraceae bacterium]